MILAFRALNNKGMPNARPWRVSTRHGAYVTSFESEWAAMHWMSRRAA